MDNVNITSVQLYITELFRHSDHLDSLKVGHVETDWWAGLRCITKIHPLPITMEG